jgi:5-oxoprolinase (ATP-hydrolysing)
MALADTVQEKHEPCSCEYESSVEEVQFRLSNLQVSTSWEFRV